MSEYLDKLEQVRTNPNLMIQLALDELDRQVNGQGTFEVPDGSHPFVFAIENGTLVAAMAMNEGISLVRRLYASNVISAEDLYLHMSDDNYLNRFANPAPTYFEFYFNKDEIISKMVPEGDTGIKKVVIPRNTVIKVAGHDFTMQYPIIIRQMRHGGLQIVYDLDKLSPLQTLDSNIVQSKELLINRKWYLLLRVPVLQFSMKTYTETLNPTLPFEGTFSFTDQYFHVRAYISDSVLGWREINTTHSDQVYDPTRLTLVLKVLNGKVFAEFPLVYTTNGSAAGELRIDVFTTKGVIDVDLGSYDRKAFEVDFNTIDDDKTFTDPLNHIGEFSAMNPSRVRGGSNAVDFETLRNTVIDGVMDGAPFPITDVQLNYFLQRKGYNLVSNVNNITHRQFLASRRLPAPSNNSVASAVGTMMAQTQLSMEALALSAHVADNGARITLLPTILFDYKDGVISVVEDGRIAQLRNASPEQVSRLILDGNYLYTPFHYVLDSASANFDVRPYYFGEPSVVRKTHVGDNDSSQLQATIDTYSIERISNGFRIKTKLKTDDQFKQLADELVVVQMGYRPVGENNYASLNGTLIGIEDNERIYQFDILTNFDVDSANSLYTTNMSMFDLAQNHFALAMEHDMDFTVIVDQIQGPDYVGNEIDAMLQEHLLDHTFMAVIRERLTVRFGYELTDLWRRNRTVLSQESYQHYGADVPAVYSENVYLRDEDGNIVVTAGPGDSLVYTILHHKNDPILDAQNQPVMQYRKGDTVLDAQGDPVLLAPRKILREFTMFLVDGMYYFATEAASADYRDEIPMQVVEWVQGDIANVRKQLLDEAEIYFYPITTFGNTTATVRDGLKADISLDQGLNVTYYMDAASYRNTSLRPALIETTKKIITEMLAQTRVVRSDIISALKLAAGDDVSSVEVSGLGGPADFAILTVEDDSVRLSLRKKPTILTNQELMIEDDLTINFLRH
ncbi:hypothetical protein D3C81_292040 [compost metagenome]